MYRKTFVLPPAPHSPSSPAVQPLGASKRHG
jgi:hypothetical protein